MKHLKRAAAVLICLLLLWPTLSANAAQTQPVRVAFLDSGICVKHLDAAQVEAGENFVFPARDTDDRIGHGTATAGIVLGSAELGLTGLCPTAVAVPLVCSDLYPTGVSAPGDAAVIARAIRAAVDEYGCRVINVSMGLTEDDPELRAAVEYALERGAVIVSAVGNDNLTEPDRVYYPAAYEGVIGVGAADGTQAAAFSQRNHVDVLAPGTALETVTNRNAAETVLRSGTSYACAYVSGLCAALLTAQPELTAQEVRDALFSMAEDVGQPGFDPDSGWGLVQMWDEERAEGSGGAEFADIDGHWAADSITFCTERGLFSGVGGGRFEPNGVMTRAMFAVILYRLEGEPECNGTADFTDVNGEAWYADAVCWAAENGIVSGVGNGRFAPNDGITREQVVTLLYRCAAVQGSDLEAAGETDLLRFRDGAECSDYAVSALKWAVGNGIMQGTGQDLLPTAICTRAQTAQLLKNYIRLSEQ